MTDKIRRLFPVSEETDVVSARLAQLGAMVEDEIDRLADEHPLDTLLRVMAAHKWPADDPMVMMVHEAIAVPYPMTRREAIERGML